MAFQMRSASGAHAFANLSQREQSVSALSGERKSVDLAPVSATILRSICGFSSIGQGRRKLLVTLGQFSIVRLERDAQLIVPVMDYSIPTKECCDNPGCTEDPCEMFSRIPFPASQFTPKGCDAKKECSTREQDT